MIQGEIEDFKKIGLNICASVMAGFMVSIGVLFGICSYICMIQEVTKIVFSRLGLERAVLWLLAVTYH